MSRVQQSQAIRVVGASCMAVAAFTEHINSCSVMPFGAHGRRQLPHFFDRAKLYSTSKLKPAWFYRDEIEKHSMTNISMSR